MKAKIHPNYVECTVTCGGCGTSFATRATVGEISIEICSSCHPFFTGKQRFVDSAGRVEKFQNRYSTANTEEQIAKIAKDRKRRVKKEKVTIGGPKLKKRAEVEEEPEAKPDRRRRAPEGGEAAPPPPPPKPQASEHAVRRAPPSGS